LLATGLFSLSRNPIYLGMLLVMLGLATGLADGLAFIPSLIFFIWINNWQIPAEEFHLQRHFGVAYTDYCKKVRRWL
jgi:protein-S-isoprenylcysteine O-methyltransferase Ste14